METKRAGLTKKLRVLNNKNSIRILAHLRTISRDGIAKTSVRNIAQILSLTDLEAGTKIQDLEELEFIKIQRGSRISRGTVLICGYYPFFATTIFKAYIVSTNDPNVYNLVRFAMREDKLLQSVLARLVDLGDLHGRSFPSYMQLAVACDCSISTVKRKLKLLEELGAIGINLDGFQKKPIYYVLSTVGLDK